MPTKHWAWNYKQGPLIFLGVFVALFIIIKLIVGILIFEINFSSEMMMKNL